MAASAPAITPPPGYTLENPAAAVTPPPGYTVEGSQPKAPAATLSRAPSASDMPTFGEPGINTPMQRLTMPLAKGLMEAHDKLKDIATMTQEGRQQHPIQAKIGDLVNNIEELLLGGQAAGKPMGTSSGLLNNPVSAAILPGGEAEPALAGGLREAGSLMKGAGEAFRGGEAATETAEGATKAPGIVQQVLKGKKLAQEPAKTAVRQFVGASPEKAILEGHESVADEMLSSLQKQKADAYAQIDKKVGFDFKETRDALKDAQYKIKQPEIDEATKTRLQKRIDEMQTQMNEAESKSGPGWLAADIKNADTLNTKWQATKDFRRALVQATSPDGETVNVQTLLNSLKRLRNNVKYGDRLEQVAGNKEAADSLMEDLQNAQKLGEKAMDKQRIAKIIGKYAAYALAGGSLGYGIGRAAYESVH